MVRNMPQICVLVNDEQWDYIHQEKFNMNGCIRNLIQNEREKGRREMQNVGRVNK